MKKTIRLTIAMSILLGLTGCERTLDQVAKWKAQKNVSKLTAALNDSEQDIRLAAIEALGELKSADAVDALGAQLNNPDFVIAHKAIDALVQIGGPKADQYLLETLQFETAKGRAAAAAAMGSHQVAEAVEPLILALNDEHEPVAVAAAVSLGQLGDPRAVAPLAAKLGERSHDIRFACVVALGKIGTDDAAVALAPTMGDFSGKIRDVAVEAMVKIGPASVPGAIDGLHSSNAFARESAIAVLKGTGQVPTAGNDFVWYRLAGLTIDPKGSFDPAQVQPLAGIAGGSPALLEAAAHPDDNIREYAFQALELIGESCAPEAVAAAIQNATPSAKKWFEQRTQWRGAPAWQLDLWGAATALSSKFELNKNSVKKLQTGGSGALTLLSSPQFKPAREYIPLLIGLFATEPSAEKQVQDRAVKVRTLAEKQLLAVGQQAYLPLLAALNDADLEVASWSAETLMLIDKENAAQAVIEAFARKLEAGADLYDSPLLIALQKIDDPAVEGLLIKVRPNDARAIQVFERQFPGVRVSPIPMQFQADPNLMAMPFRLGYQKDGRSKELKVIFRPDEEGDWVPNPPLPDTLP